MSLTLYRRHGRHCPYYGKPRNARNNRACKKRCPIWVQGSLGREYIRRSLDLTCWEAAVNLVRSWEAAGHSGGATPVLTMPDVPVSPEQGQVVPPLENGSGRSCLSAVAEPGVATAAARQEIVPPIPEAIDHFMASLDNQNLSPDTIRTYRRFLKGRLLSWCTEHGHSALWELSVTRMDDFRATWPDGPAYAGKNIERLRTFFQFCVVRGWIDRNPGKAIKTPKVNVVPTLPYTEAEMTRILAACDRYPGDKDRMRAFVLVMRYSGLRISDTISLHADQRIEHRLRLYTTKTGQPVYVPLPPFVVEALEKIERPGHRYFSSEQARLASARANWSRYLDRVFELANVENGRSHRFRDTFSTSLLEKGVPVEMVAMLLGNTPAIVVKHYAPWIKSRQLALEAAVQTIW